MGEAKSWFVGTSGWNYAHWRGVFYPAGVPSNRWLAYYAGCLRTVEINNSFYRLPEAETFARWREETPPDFLFAVKASRYLTHQKKLKEPQEALSRLLAHSAALGEKLGPILYQLPPRWHVNCERLRAFLDLLPPRLRHVFEFRDSSWHCDAVYSLLDAHGCGYCIMSAPGLPCHLIRTGGFLYLRMHGTEPYYAGSYPDEALAEWIARLKELGTGEYPAYVYFNNDTQGYAIKNARRFLELLGGK